MISQVFKIRQKEKGRIVVYDVVIMKQCILSLTVFIDEKFEKV
jgi:hypothetical protein